MEVNKQPRRRERKDLAVKKVPDLNDVTIYNTPLPQATSTVHGKTRRSHLDEQSLGKHRQLNFDQSNATANSEESLGIIQNLSLMMDENDMKDLKSKKDTPNNGCDLERELARRALQKWSDIGVPKPDKENNVNTSNLLMNNSYNRHSGIKSPSTLSNQIKNPKQSVDNKSIASSLIFEPNEMSARSSSLNKTPEKSDPFPQDFSGVSFNSNMAEMMAQFGDEDFMSGSKANSQLMADEISWRKNKPTSLPISNNNEKERLEFSCFSGVMGDVDVTMDSGKVSIGEFFKRKCGGTGHLSIASGSDRPSIGLNNKSPQRQRVLRPLVDQTMTEGSVVIEDKETKSADCTKDPSVMSLSTIAQILQDIDSATPRKLVDQILDANKKKKKQHKVENNVISDTYTLLPTANRTSLPVSTTYTAEKFDKDTTKSSFGNKLSLDSKNISDLLSNKTLSEIINEEELVLNPKLKRILEMKINDSLPETTQQSENKSDGYLSGNQSNQSNQSNKKSSNGSVPRAEQSSYQLPIQLSQITNTQNKFPNSFSINDKSSLIHDTGPSDVSDPTLPRSNSTAKEDTLTNSLVKNQSFDTSKVVIGERTQELCTCIVGIPKEADFELYNGTDRWILCNLKLYQIQGEKDNIQLSLPDDDILIEPDARKCFKIGVKMPRMGKLTIVIFHLPCSDMVTRTSWYMKHIMCFVPEEPNIKISMPSEDNFINFQTITEDSSNSIPITFENHNSIDVPVLLRLNQGKPELFSIGECLDETISSVSPQRESMYIILKPRSPLTINMDFKGISLQSFGEKVLRKGVFNAEGNLSISICFKENEEYIIKEISLKGSVGSCKLDVIDTQFPMVLQTKICKFVNLKNTGSIAVSATADVVQSKENQKESRDFLICPNNIVLNGGEKLVLQVSYKPENNKTDTERHAMIRIVVGNKVSFYPIIGEKVIEYEQMNSDSFNQYQRCETPQRLRDISSPTSPHSIVMNRSGTSGRHSPGSTVSGGTAQTGTAIPIRATHTALVWGNVKVGKSDVKQFTVRNTSNGKLKLVITIKSQDQNFKFVKERHVVSSMTLSLQGMESKTLSVMFAPNIPKACAGKIIFSHYSAVRETRELSGIVKVINLFGYGGYGKMEISEAVKDTSGHMWLSLGKLNSEGILHGKIKLHNTGDLTCFAKLKLIPKAVYPNVLTSWHVEPTELLLEPNQVQWICLEYRPRKDDFVNIHQVGVTQVGTLKITHGDEPTRLRIRRLYNKLKDSGQLNDKVDENGDEFKEIINPICKAFPGERFLQDLKLIRDSVQNLGDLCKGIVQNEVKLTIEVHADETISMLQDNMDDSEAFYSLCSDHDTESHFGESFLPAD